MLSGEGKTTTLKLLRNSLIYDINKRLNKSEIKNVIDEIKSNTEISEGVFEV